MGNKYYYILKDKDGLFKPEVFMFKEEQLKYYDKDIERLEKEGGSIVLVEIKEI